MLHAKDEAGDDADERHPSEARKTREPSSSSMLRQMTECAGEAARRFTHSAARSTLADVAPLISATAHSVWLVVGGSGRPRCRRRIAEPLHSSVVACPAPHVR